MIDKFLFRFAFCFFLLYIVFNPNGFLPGVDAVYDLYIQPFHRLIPWVGAHVLHLPYAIVHFTGGSGDTTYDLLIYVMVFLLALVGAAVWGMVAKKEVDYGVLRYWLLVVVRYYFAFTMFSYGLAKVFRLQFSFPSLFSLTTTYGASSPMHLAWNFFGYSLGYNLFTGGAEMMAGFLLLSRRTMRVGVLVALAVAVNIMAVNYCFDVCVKFLSTILVIMAIYMATPDRSRLPGFSRRWVRLSLIVFKYVLIVYVLTGDLLVISKYLTEYANYNKPALHGIYDVQRFVLNKDTLPPLTTDTVRWRKLVVGREGLVSIRLMTDSVRYLTSEVDTTARRMVFTPRRDTVRKYVLSYASVGGGVLSVAGKWGEDSVHLLLKREDERGYLLVNRGFHFINEFPFNK